MPAPLIVVLGAGRSAGWLLSHLHEQAAHGQLRLRIVDGQLAQSRYPQAETMPLALGGEPSDYLEVLAGAHIVVSLLPPAMHLAVMEACLAVRAHFVSASYESAGGRALHQAAVDAGLLFLNECGLDPGLDHVTALAMLERVKAAGGSIASFESDCGGLPSRADLNDWGYRFFWNPMNVVTAGQAGARYVEAGKQQMIAYPEVFKRHRALFEEDGRPLVAYANRDSVPYMDAYGLQGIGTFVRGTIRYASFCSRWAALAEAGVANTGLVLEAGLPFDAWANLFEWHTQAHGLLRTLLAECNLTGGNLPEPMTSAQVLLMVLERCWNGEGIYKDRVIMQHRIGYQQAGTWYAYTGILDLEGQDHHSAMAFTVGLPIAIVIKQWAAINLRGVATIAQPQLWPIIYNNLKGYGVEMTYQTVPLPNPLYPL